MEYIKYIDVTKCDGCRACMVACKNWNDLPAEFEEFHGSYQSHKKTTANTWNVLTFTEHVTADNQFEWLYRHSSCLHCTDAACEKVCPENAISYTEYGSVVINADQCVGCGYCVQNCTFDIIELATKKDENGKEYKVAQKCTLCTDRIAEGLQPACASVCHTDAILFGEKDKMLKLASERLNQVKDRYPNANIYNPPGVGGTHTVYLLAERPSVYDLPENPETSYTAKLWKDVAQPAGKILLGASVMGVVGAYLSNRLFNKEVDENSLNEGGKDNEQK